MKQDFLIGYIRGYKFVLEELKKIIDKKEFENNPKEQILKLLGKHQHKLKTLEMNIKRMKHREQKRSQLNVVLGNSYIINEKKPKLVFNIFRQVVERKYPGICISRIQPKSLDIYSRLHDVRYYWLTKIDRGVHRKEYFELPVSDLSRIAANIQEFLAKNSHGIVLLDGIESMINNTDFQSVLKLLESLKDHVAEKKGVLLISMDFDVLNEQQKSFILREFEYIFED